MVFLKLMKKIHLLMSFQSDTRENAYITVVAKNEALQVLKKQKAESGIDFDLLENKIFTYSDDIDRKIIANEQWSEIREIIKELTPIQREAIYLRFFMELEYPEIADVMNTNINNARARVHSAIVKMREAATKRGDLNG